MLQSSSFIRKTRRGGVMKVVREKYLRNDIPCGIHNCTVCFPNQENVFDDIKSKINIINDEDENTSIDYPNNLNTSNSHDRDRCIITTPLYLTLTKNPSSSFLKNKAIDGQVPHIIVPDTNILRHQLDLLENKEAFHDVVILQTVLEELRHLSYPLYQRARRMIEDPERKFYVLSNEHHKDCAIDRLPNETPNDRNDRSIRTAVKWLNEHFKKFSKSSIISSNTLAILLSDDLGNRQKALNEDIPAFSSKTYATLISDKFPNIIDLVATSSDDLEEGNVDSKNSDFRYDNHLSTKEIMLGINSNSLHQGSINISSHNCFEGTMLAKLNGADSQIHIIGRENLNRAVHGDTVAIKIFPKSEWISGLDSSTLIDDDENDSNSETEKVDNNKKDTKKPKVKDEFLKPTGKVVGIIRRNWRPYCGTIDKESVQRVNGNQSLQSVFFWSIDRRVPKIRIRTRQADYLLGKRIIVSVDSWPIDSKYPNGHFIRTLGDCGDRETETEVLLLENDVPYAPFSKQVLSFLPEEGDKWIVKDEHLEGREDFRHLDVCSIDPPGCTDIDDALHCIPLKNGNFQVGVHIADVSHFVKPGNSMDLEARRRGTTVYLVNKRIDMLPPLLGTNLCSLHCNVDRLAFSVIWEITPDAEIVNTKYTKSIIRSRASLEYSEAQARLDDKNATDPVSIGIKGLNSLAKKLAEKRKENGALTLSSPEVKFTLEEDQQDPLDVEMKQLQETNKLVEEFMLLANISVARKIHEHFPETAVLRRHPQPLQESFEKLNAALEDIGLPKLETSSSKKLADSLDRSIVKDEPYLNNLFRIMTTRCMMQANYFCSGTFPYKDFWHYGIACDIYTHFTSPIRRYADLMVHRLLALAIDYERKNVSELTNKDAIQEITDVLNFRHRAAQQASRASVELFTSLLFKDKIIEEQAYVVRILKNGIGVFIPKYGIDGFVYLDDQSGKNKELVDVQEPKVKRSKNEKSKSDDIPTFEFEFEDNSGHILLGPKKTVIKIFSKVSVRISVVDSGNAAAARTKVQMHLLKY